MAEDVVLTKAERPRCPYCLPTEFSDIEIMTTRLRGARYTHAHTADREVELVFCCTCHRVLGVLPKR